MEKKNVFEVTIKFNKKEFEEAIDKAFEKKAKDIKMDGFRKGKVPKDIYIKKVGKESLYMDAVDYLLPKAYDKALKEGKYEPIIEPKVELKNLGEDGVEFLFTITTMPEVTIKKYTGLKVKHETVSVTDKEVDEEVKNLLKRFSELTVKEGAIKEGDTAVIDFEGFLDGKAFDGGKGENYPLEIGSHTFIPGFEEQLVGLKKDAEKDIKVTFPEDYQADNLAGKEVTFKIKVNEVKEKKERKLDEEFFEDLGMEGVNSEETLKEEIKKSLLANKEMDNENKLIDELLKAVAKETTVDIPEELIHEEVHHMIHRFEDQLRMQGISMEVYHEMTKTTHEDLEKQMEGEAKNHILYRFIIDTIKDKENIKVTDKEVDQEIDKLSKQYNVSSEEFLKMYGSKDMMKYELEVKKVLDFLKENN